MNSNKSADALAGSYGLFAFSCIFWLGTMFLLAWLLLRRRMCGHKIEICVSAPVKRAGTVQPSLFLQKFPSLFLAHSYPNFLCFHGFPESDRFCTFLIIKGNKHLIIIQINRIDKGIHQCLPLVFQAHIQLAEAKQPSQSNFLTQQQHRWSAYRKYTICMLR